MSISIPDFSLVVLIGISGSGKSSFAQKHFKKTEILSSDTCRGLVSDDENNQAATTDAFDVLHYIAAKRLKNRLLTVIDATNVQAESRKAYLELAKKYHCFAVAIILNIPEKICQERNKTRSDRNMGSYVLRNQYQQLKSSMRNLKREGFRFVHHISSVEQLDAITEIKREKLYNDKNTEHGPFDIIGDIHGCFEELQELLQRLGYVVNKVEDDLVSFGFQIIAPYNRKLVFLGDLTDRGPDSIQVLRLVMSAVNSGLAYCVSGNHDSKLLKYLTGKDVQLKHGLDLTVQQLESESSAFKNILSKFLDSLISHYVFDNGKLAVSHAGIKEEMLGRGSGAIRSFCLYGETTGETDEFGLPVRLNWAAEYRGDTRIVYGHSPVPQSEWLNKTINIDTGCVFGGKLTALRYPEEEIVSVAAKKTYYEPTRPLGFASGQQAVDAFDEMLDIDDVVGKRIVQTGLKSNITIREENSIAALEVMSRFAVNPKWLIYLPPTMSPCASSPLDNFLEHPEQALDYYKKQNIEKVICEEKHMGSRAVVIICKDEKTAQVRFGIKDDGFGICYTRTGRNFFNDASIEHEFLLRVQNSLTAANFWQKFETDWVCLDTELMPWSAKAQALIKDQYASVGAAASAALNEITSLLKLAYDGGVNDVLPLLKQYDTKHESVANYIQAYRQYCWPVHTIEDFKLAPFHILASEGKVHSDKTHQWNMEQIHEICRFDTAFLKPTPYKIVDLNDSGNCNEAVQWWLDLTAKGGEGMVVKPYDFIATGKNGLVQPAVKCRGREYLRIIYGPEYTEQKNLERLKNRSLSRKQSLALREFALGMEGLERFINKEPLRRIHESVFAVLALESEDVDPRL